MNLKKAFTLAEVLIIIIVIGVLAILVIPALKENMDEKTHNSQKKVFLTKLNSGLQRMQIKNELARTYNSTDDFVTAMKKHFNFTKVCSQNNLQDCFGSKLISEANIYNITSINNSYDIGIRFKTNSNVNGLIFGDGTAALIAYEPNCKITNTFDTSIDLTKCMAMYFSVDGVSGAHVVNADVFTINTGERKIDIGEIYTPKMSFDISQCERAKAEGVPITACSMNTDYYAYAKWVCHQKDKRLPTRAEFAKIVEKMYGQSVSSTETTSNLQVTDKNSELWKNLGNNVFWTSEQEKLGDDAYSWTWPYWVKIKEDKMIITNGWSQEEDVYGQVSRSFIKFFCID